MTGRRTTRTLVPSVLATLMLAFALPGSSEAVAGVPGGAGTDTSLPATESKLTIGGRGSFASLEVSVNQTRNLANQAVSVTWTGGSPTTDFGGVPFGEHFLQMFQCWGDDDGSVPENPGPPPEQCQQGATIGEHGGTQTGALFSGYALTRVISQRGAPNFDPSLGALDEFGTVSLPFRAVDGTVIPQWRDTAFNPQLGGGSYWLNPYYNLITTNEVPGARTNPSGEGAELFEATTGLESTGLGCGQQVQKLDDGTSKVPRCWLVVVPRGSAAEENEGGSASQFSGVATSPLAPSAWKNRLAFPLEFNPIDACRLSDSQRRIVGSELLAGAVASWQPALCATPGLSPYAYGAISDSRARQQLLSQTPGSPGMAVVSRPIDPATVSAENPVVYAPLSLSGTVIGFNVERIPRVFFPPGEDPPQAVLDAMDRLAGVRAAQLNLTPRLVAKLLTQSYRFAVEIGNSKPPYPWVEANPLHMVVDPDFLQFNPEFRLLQTPTKNMAGLVLPGPSSDAALQVWEWILSDPEARTWLAGTADPWGMSVNPVYAASPSLNPQGASFGDPLPDSYPKSDPYCFQGPEAGPLKVTPPPLCGLDWFPYTQSLREAARAARAASDGARTLAADAPTSPDQVYRRDPPQAIGRRAILSVTDTASAAQYGLQVARLSRAGDNGVDRTFVAADQSGLRTGGDALAAKAVPGFREPVPATAPAGAYPLTAITYAAVAPLGLDTTARHEYAAFVDYAAGPGQTPGVEYGRLPPGYQPLPESLRAEGLAAADTIRSLVGPPPPPDPGPSAPAPTASEPPFATGAGEQPSAASEPTPAAGAPEAVPVPSPGAPPAARTGVLEEIAASVLTPAYAVAATRYALPLLVVVALLSALGALEITKRRSRWAPVDPTEARTTGAPGASR